MSNYRSRSVEVCSTSKHRKSKPVKQLPVPSNQQNVPSNQQDNFMVGVSTIVKHYYRNDKNLKEAKDKMKKKYDKLINRTE